uniref:Uncharacterized protein n=1 Tax=Tanacetum cinerariifolium TaxID=118510 RepID=A0A699JZ98_TANCI|nr:hypothetical protein [Tanacetum cinerariifolium]
MEEVGYYELNGSVRIHDLMLSSITQIPPLSDKYSLLAIVVQRPIGGFIVGYGQVYGHGPTYILNNGAWHYALRYFQGMRTTDRRHVNLTASTPDQAIQYDLGPFAMRGGQGRGRGAMLGPDPSLGGGMLEGVTVHGVITKNFSL